MLLHSQAEGIPQDTEEGSAAWYTYEEAEAELLVFAREALRIWKEKEVYFKLTDKEVDIRKITNNV